MSSLFKVLKSASLFFEDDCVALNDFNRLRREIFHMMPRNDWNKSVGHFRYQRLKCACSELLFQAALLPFPTNLNFQILQILHPNLISSQSAESGRRALAQTEMQHGESALSCKSFGPDIYFIPVPNKTPS